MYKRQANASLISNKSTSSKLHLAFFTDSRTASIGPKPISAGSTPTEAQDTILANGSIDFFSTSSKEANNKAAAPSFIPEEFPGVTVPFLLKTVFNFFRSDKFRSALGCSSLSRKFPS